MLTFDYLKVDEETILKIDNIREEYKSLYNKISQLKGNRELSLAITNLEQSLMWCNKSICISSVDNHPMMDESGIK